MHQHTKTNSLYDPDSDSDSDLNYIFSTQTTEPITQQHAIQIEHWNLTLTYFDTILFWKIWFARAKKPT